MILNKAIEDKVKARFFMVIVGLVLIGYYLADIHSSYERLYKLELSGQSVEGKQYFNPVDSIYKMSDVNVTIKPSEELSLHRKITFNIINIIGLTAFLLSLWLGKISQQLHSKA